MFFCFSVKPKFFTPTHEFFVGLVVLWLCLRPQACVRSSSVWWFCGVAWWSFDWNTFFVLLSPQLWRRTGGGDHHIGPSVAMVTVTFHLRNNQLDWSGLVLTWRSGTAPVWRLGRDCFLVLWCVSHVGLCQVYGCDVTQWRVWILALVFFFVSQLLLWQSLC